MVGLVHSVNDSHVGDFKVVLPNGKICPYEDHGIPRPPRYFHGAREVGGMLYLCGGQTNPPPVWHGKFSRLFYWQLLKYK